MSEEIEITCPRCKHQWRQSLQKLEKLETIYKAPSGPGKARKIETYRACCPNDGTYIVIEVGEE